CRSGTAWGFVRSASSGTSSLRAWGYPRSGVGERKTSSLRVLGMKSSGISIPRPVPVDPAMVDSVGWFEDFYRTNAERVHRALAVTLGDPYLAQEATDEAMARACARWRRVGRLDNPCPWTVRRRAAAMRRWRAAGVAARSAVGAAASIGVPYAFAARPTGGTGVGQPAVASEPTPAAAAPAQRLILRDAGI